MSFTEGGVQKIRMLLINNKISTISGIRKIFGQCARMTIFRVLSELDYLSSYSHRGAYYTLSEIAEFDDQGLWRCGDVCFSKAGTLGNTIFSLLPESGSGYTVAELDVLLGVETKHACRKLFTEGKVDRRKINGRYVYLCKDDAIKRRQVILRKDSNTAADIGIGVDVELLPDEARAAIILFYSLLNEKQRRLYAGLEAAKFGHGGDRKIAGLLNMDPHTVAKGRRELFSGNVDDGIRTPGGGNTPTEKKRQSSST